MTLEDQYGQVENSLRDKVIEVIYNIIYYSNIDINIKSKIAEFLARYKRLFQEDEGYNKLLENEMFELLEGSFGKVFSLDDSFVKKQLKPEYWTEIDIASR